jgi:hypothetical protein
LGFFTAFGIRREAVKSAGDKKTGSEIRLSQSPEIVAGPLVWGLPPFRMKI